LFLPGGELIWSARLRSLFKFAAAADKRRFSRLN
jgi:hypothetical protein